jgi:hypothetical protein
MVVIVSKNTKNARNAIYRLYSEKNGAGDLCL